VSDSPLELMYLFKRVVSSMVLPPYGLFVLSAVMLLVAMRMENKRFALRVACLSLLLGLMTSTNWVSRHLLSMVESFAGDSLTLESTKAILAAPNPPQAVVILAGGQSFDEREPGGPVTPSPHSLQRTLYGARLSKQTGLKVLVTGGATPPHTVAEAQSMAQLMTMDLGLKPNWVEATSLDTRANALHSAKLLLPDGVNHVFLVTHAAHMMRSRIEFERAGFKVTAAPMGFQAGQGAPRLMSWLPSPASAMSTWYAVHELVGLLWYRISSPVPGLSSNSLTPRILEQK
jgi:uncharacterized SAM-binding protein YcdF (DUF218 family)